jgi:hypothetical protein
MRYQMMINPETATRGECIAWLSWSDPNGCYVDESCDMEDIPRLTLENARFLVADQMLACAIDADDVDMTDADMERKYGVAFVAARRVRASGVMS